MMFSRIAIRHLFTRLVIRNAATFEAIQNHPVPAQWVDGTLEPNKSLFYYSQDGLYLDTLEVVLDEIADRSQHPAHARHFRMLSKNTNEIAKDVKKEYLKQQDLPYFERCRLPPIKKSPIISCYTEHILDMPKTLPVAHLIAKILPCFWAYYLLGKKQLILPVDKLQNSPFRNLLLTFSSPAYFEATEFIVEIFEELSQNLSCFQGVARDFALSADFELEFFNAVLGSELCFEPNNSLCMVN